MRKTLSLFFTLLLLIAAAFVPLAAPSAAQVLPTATPTIIGAPTIFFITTPIPSPTPGCAAPLPLVIGGTAVISGGVYVRNAPSASAPFVNYYAEAVTVRVVDGPVCDGANYNWWAVSGPGLDGWVAEGRPDGYWMRFGEGVPGSECAPPAPLTVGGETRLLRSVRVRAEPDRGGLVLTVAPADASADVLEGPTCADGLNWWRVSVIVLDITYTGWMADTGDDETALLADPTALAASVCDDPAAFAPGARAYVSFPVSQSPKNIRTGPGLSFDVVATLVDGVGLTVLDGPLCRDGYQWWRVEVLTRPDVTGWFADEWLVPLRSDLRPPIR